MGTVFECRTRGDYALLAALTGQDPRPWNLDPCRQPPAEKWNGTPDKPGIGSQNFRPTAEAALASHPASASAANLEFFRQLAEVWLGQGLWGRELGSELYTPSQIVAWMAARRAAARAADEALQGRIDACLAATWAWFALIAVPTPSTRVVADLEGETLDLKGDTNFYPRGPTVALAGDRWNAGVLRQRLTGPLLAWALDLPRQYKRYDPTPQLPEGPPEGDRLRVGGQVVQASRFDVPYHLPLSQAGCLLAPPGAPQAAPYEAPVPASPFGLTDGQRQILRRTVAGDVAAAREALSLLQPGGEKVRVWTGYRAVDLIRTDRGAMMICHALANNNKPGHPATSCGTDGGYRTICPSVFRGVGATFPEVEVGDGEVVARADGRVARLPRIGGSLLWHVRLDPQGWTVVGGQLAG